jgi:tetratricopeptide repeat protein 21B
MEEVLVTINYYIREKLWCSIRNLVDSELRKGQDPVLIFWKSYGIFNEGRVTEAIRELTRVQDRREVQFAASFALVHFHERCRNVDQEAIDTLVLQ